MIKNVAVIGATGMLGKPVVHALVASGFSVTALVRNKARAQKILPSSVQLVRGDLQQPEHLDALLAGQDAVYLNLGVAQNERRTAFHAETDGLKNIISSARKHSLQRIAMISSLVQRYEGMNGFSWWPFQVKHEAVALLRSSGVPYTIFYPSTFMENFEDKFRLGNMILLAGQSEHKMFFVAASDYGKQVATALREDKRINKEYVVQGKEGFTADEAAQVFARHHPNRKLKLVHAPLGVMKFFANFSRTASYGVNIVEAMNKYPESFEAETTWRDLGEPEITLEQFARSSVR